GQAWAISFCAASRRHALRLRGRAVVQRWVEERGAPSTPQGYIMQAPEQPPRAQAGASGFFSTRQLTTPAAPISLVTGAESGMEASSGSEQATARSSPQGFGLCTMECCTS